MGLCPHLLRGDRSALQTLLPGSHMVNRPTHRTVREESALLRMIADGAGR